MYPNLYYAFQDLFGVEPWKGLRFVNSFGFFVALAFVSAALVLSSELRRKSKQGLLHYEEAKIVVGQPATPVELIINFLLGFILGYKIIGALISDSPLADNPSEYIFSAEGNWPVGIIAGLFFAGLKWWEKNKQKLSSPEERTIRIWPHDRVGDLVIFAAVFGFLGAKLFHNLENLDELMNDPLGSLFSFSGLTFYGGLICAALAIWWYAGKHGIKFWHLNDAAAPGLMLSYAVGRIGCQVAGDGDWGVINSAYLSDPQGKSSPATEAQFQTALQSNQDFFVRTFGSMEKVDRLHFKGPDILPDWMFAYPYPHNVINEGIPLQDCSGQYCAYLPIPVFPTPFYELLACLLLFFVMWSLRKRIKIPGYMFAIYLILNGIERFLIEKIRVNTTYSIFGFHPTQAEIISFLFIVTGIVLLVYLRKRHANRPPEKKMV